MADESKQVSGSNHAVTDSLPHVAVVGAGFGGLWAIRKLAHRPVRVTLFDRNNYHTFQPLLYQVAAAEIEPEQIGYPVRGILRNMPDVSFALAEVTAVNPQTQTITANGEQIAYDYLILATGSVTQFFGTPGTAEHAFSLKSMEEAVLLRNHILTCFERAVQADAGLRQRLLTFVVVGGGPTGVEYAGALSELVRGPLSKDFPELDICEVSIVLVEATGLLLGAMPEKLRNYATEQVKKMGIVLRLETRVTAVTPTHVTFQDGTMIPTSTVVWVAGVGGEAVAQNSGIEVLRNGRVPVRPTLQLPNHDNIYVIGDLAAFEQDDKQLPMVAQVAIQQGTQAARNILRQLADEPPQPFRYKDKGSMATIGRNKAVADINGRHLTGFLAWLIWLFIHILYIIGFRNQIVVLFTWAYRYLTFEQTVRLILPSHRAVQKMLVGASQISHAVETQITNRQ
jgi:NADH dehydrogenase